MELPTIGQLKTLGAYLFVIATGAYVGAEYWGLAGGIVGAVVAVPMGIVLGLTGLVLLATLLGYDSKKTNKEEA